MNAASPNQQWHTIVTTVENKPGVLARVSGLFSRRNYNIHSLAVAPTDDERFSRITFTVDVEGTPLDQVVKQLNKRHPPPHCDLRDGLQAVRRIELYPD